MNTLTDAEIRALDEALDDEYQAWATYDQVIADFGEVAPAGLLSAPGDPAERGRPAGGPGAARRAGRLAHLRAGWRADPGRESGRDHLLRPLGIPVALITDGSLVWREDVRVALHKADWLSLKVDATDPVLWRRVNRPDPALHLDAILFGISRLAADYRGTLTTETMLVSGVNDSMDAIGAVADYLATIGPSIAYLAAPTRPPAEPGVGPPDDATLARAFQGTIASTKGHCPNRPEKRDKDRELRPDSPCEALRRALVSAPEYRYRRYASALPSYLEPPTILAIPDL